MGLFAFLAKICPNTLLSPNMIDWALSLCRIQLLLGYDSFINHINNVQHGIYVQEYKNGIKHALKDLQKHGQSYQISKEAHPQCQQSASLSQGSKK